MMRPQDLSFPDGADMEHCDENPHDDQDYGHRRGKALDPSATQLVRDVYRSYSQSLISTSASPLQTLLDAELTAFGNTKPQQLIVNFILVAPDTTETVDKAKNQNPMSHRNMPAGTPIAFQTSPTGMEVMPR